MTLSTFAWRLVLCCIWRDDLIQFFADFFAKNFKMLTFLRFQVFSECQFSSVWFSFTILCSVCFLLVWNWFGIKKRKGWKSLENFKGPPTLPILGSAHLLNLENHELFQFSENHVKLYGKISKIWLFHKPYILIADADVVEKILTSKLSLDKGDDMKVFHPWWGSGLLTASASTWRNQRKLLNHTFSHSVLVEFLEIFNKESLLLQGQLEKYATSNKEFNIIPILTSTTLNIICETAMGKKLDSGNEHCQNYVDAVTGMYHILVARMTRPWLRPELIWKLSWYGRKEQQFLNVLHGFTEKVIQEKIELRKQSLTTKLVVDSQNNVEGKKTRMAFMDYLLDLVDNGHNLSNIQIRNEVDTFMAAGHDTTAYTVSWTLFLLSTYPQHQVKVQEELDQIFDHSPTQPVSSCDLSKMKYLTLCIKEALRIYPIVPFNFRKLSEDIKIDDYRTIPSGINVVIMPYILHKDPDYFPSPEEFRPERFLAANYQERHPFSYIPFSAGARVCIGQKFGMNESKVILSHLLRAYNWMPLDKREDLQLDLDLVIRPMNGLRFKISKRF